MKSYPILIFACLLTFLACSPTKTQEEKKEDQTNEAMPTRELDIQGHRGARGLMPENTIPAFIEALKYGVTTLELDLAVSKDSLLVVSHEPWMNENICLDNQGNRIEGEMKFNLHQMTYDEIKEFDCGSLGNPRFPEQKKIKTVKPLLIDVIKAVNEHIDTNNMKPVKYNMEIKSMPQGDNLFHPTPEVFSNLLVDFLTENDLLDVTTVQSFDFRVIQYFNQKFPDVSLALLIENELSIQKNLDSLGFNPDVYSCYFKLLDPSKVEFLHNANIKVIPWTVNEIADMQELIDWGVDGLITDYPNRSQQFATTSAAQ